MTESEPPENAWAWIVGVASWINALLILIPFTTFGIVYTDLVTNTGVSAVAIGWIISLNQFMLGTSGFLSGPLCQQFGHRKVAFFGALLGSASIVLTGFINTPLPLFLLFSLCHGFSIGSTIVPSNFIVSQYFKKRRGFVLGFIRAFQAISALVGAPLLTHLQSTYGKRGTIFILGSLLFNCCVCALTFHPVEWHSKNAKRKPLLKGKESDNVSERENSLKHGGSDMDIQNGDKNKQPELDSDESGTKEGAQNVLLACRTQSENVSASSWPSIFPNTTANPSQRFSAPSLESSTPIIHLKMPLLQKGKSENDISTRCPFYYDDIRLMSKDPIRENNKCVLPSQSDDSNNLLELTPSKEHAGETSPISKIPCNSKEACKNDVREGRSVSFYSSIKELVVSTYRNIVILKSHRMKILGMANAVQMVVYVNGLTLIPFVLKEKGFSLEDAAWALGWMSIGNVGFRIVPSLLVDYFSSFRRHIYMVGTLCYSMGLLACSITTNLTVFAGAVAVFGIGVGCCMVLSSLLFIDIMGLEYFSTTLSVDYLLKSLAHLACGPIIGFIRDMSGDYSLSLQVLAGFGVFAFLPLLLIPWATCSDRKRRIAQPKGSKDREINKS